MKKTLAIVMALALMLTCFVNVSATADVTATVETVDGPFSAGDEIALAITITEWANAYATINITMPEYDESLLEFDGFDSGADFSGALSSSGSLGFALVASPSSNREANKLKSGEVCVLYFIAKTDINVSTPVSVVVTANGYTSGSEDNWIANHALTVENVSGGINFAHNCAPAGDIQYDETDHWYNCATVGCGNQLQKAPHTGGTATCSAKAECEVCGAEYGALDAENHVGQTEVRNAAEADCGNDGYTGDTYCLGCNGLLEEGQPIPATGNHTGGEATCNAKAECSVCGQEYGDLNVQNHVGGTEVRNAAEADCGNDGYTGDTYCLGCDELLEEGEPIPATGNHTGGEATCQDKAECEVCGQEYGEKDADNHVGSATGEYESDENNHWFVCECGEDVQPAAHTGGEATCKAKAECEVCGAEYGDINANNHKGETEVRGAVPASCYEEGYTGDTYCLDCDEMIEEGEVIPATGNHVGTGDYQYDETDHWKDCDTVGCGNKVNKAPHEGGEATCQDKAVCEVCGAEYGEKDADNHFGGEATCSAKAVCEGCGEEYGEVDADNHVNTEERDGDIWCNDCGEMVEEGEPLPPTSTDVETPTDPTVPPTGDASAVAVAGAVCLAAAAAFVFMKKRG